MARRALGASIVPLLIAVGALFMVLPQGGADAEARMVALEEGWGYEPAELTVARGARVAFRNDSRVTHTATCLGCPWDTGDVQPGQTVFLTFEADASDRFFCRYHGARWNMVAEITSGTPPPELEPPPGEDGEAPPG